MPNVALFLAGKGLHVVEAQGFREFLHSSHQDTSTLSAADLGMEFSIWRSPPGKFERDMGFFIMNINAIKRLELYGGPGGEDPPR